MTATEIIGNRYIISKRIGEGGMADVYLAVDSILKRQVAIKVLRGELNNDPVNLKRFQKEANAITSLSHPNIVEVYDVGEESNKNYIVMEYVPGKTLKQLIKARGALYPDEAINIMKQLVSATAHAHKNNIIHRDIKSQNVLVKDDGSVKLSDFGIAFTGDSQQLTQTDTVMGSVHYLAPELAKGQQATVQSDIYSLGVVFYEMLTGDVPFHGDTAVQIAIKHMHDDIPSVLAFNPDLPQSVENIIIRATAKDRNERYAAADEMYNDLVTCLDFSRIHEQKLLLDSVKAKQEVRAASKPAQQPVKLKKVKKTSTIAGMTPSGILASLAAVALAVALFYIILILNGQLGPEANKVTVPEVAGYSIEDATQLLEANNLTVQSIERESTEDVEKDIVLRTSPRANQQVEPNTPIILYVSAGKYFKIEKYVGQNINSVKTVLENAGFTVNVTETPDDSKEPGTILTQSLEVGTKLEPLEPKMIDFEVSAVKSFHIPNVIGWKKEDAKAEIEKEGGKVEFKALPAEENLDEDGNYKVPPGTIVKVDPDVATFYSQTAGKKITLYHY